MRKLKLDTDGLRVESFTPASIADATRGTVQARSDDRTLYACNPTDKYYETCDISCWYQCFPSDRLTCLGCE